MAKVAVTENDKYERFELNDDGTLSLSLLRERFPHITGLWYKYKSNNVARAVMICDGYFHLPLNVEWKNYVFYGVLKEKPKLERKAMSIAEHYELEPFQMIVMGVPPKTTVQEFYNYFSIFGKLCLCELRRDPKTGKAKGYGFIKYTAFNDQYCCITSDLKIADNDLFLRLPTHNLDESLSKRRILVTDITPSVTTIDLLEYFNVFGRITEFFMPRGFNAYAFITFKQEDAVYNILKFGESHRVFGGFVIVERFQTKKESDEVHLCKTLEAQKAQKLRTCVISRSASSIQKRVQRKQIPINLINNIKSAFTTFKQNQSSEVNMSVSSKKNEHLDQRPVFVVHQSSCLDGGAQRMMKENLVIGVSDASKNYTQSLEVEDDSNEILSYKPESDGFLTTRNSKSENKILSMDVIPDYDTQPEHSSDSIQNEVTLDNRGYVNPSSKTAEKSSYQTYDVDMDYN